MSQRNTNYGALVTEWGSSPIAQSLPEPDATTSDTTRVRVLYAAAHGLVRSRASGKHYGSNLTLPHLPGSDGVGLTDDGKLVYFNGIRAGGSFQAFVNVPKGDVYELPAGIAEGERAGIAAMVNPAMSSWLAVKTRVYAERVPKNPTAVILGATAASGLVAASLLPILGYKSIIGVARSASKLAAVKGLTSSVVLAPEPKDTDYSTLSDVDLVLDYVAGPHAVHLMNSLQSKRETQFVQIGALSGPADMTLPFATTRNRKLTLMASALGTATVEENQAAMKELMAILPNLAKPGFVVEDMKDIEKVWDNKVEGKRIVFKL